MVSDGHDLLVLIGHARDKGDLDLHMDEDGTWHVRLEAHQVSARTVGGEGWGSLTVRVASRSKFLDTAIRQALEALAEAGQG